MPPDGYGNGVRDVDAPLGDIVNRISLNASALVREEIELAKAEMEMKVKRLVRGAVVGAAAGFFVFLGLIFAFHTLAWSLNDFFDGVWDGVPDHDRPALRALGVAGLHRVQALPGRRAPDARHGDRGGQAHARGARAPGGPAECRPAELAVAT